MTTLLLVALLSFQQNDFQSAESISAESIPESPGVIVPEGGFRNRVLLVTGGTISEAVNQQTKFAAHLESDLPEDDRNRFRILVFVGQDLQSRRLQQDFMQNQDLAALRKWCAYREMDGLSEASAEYRERAKVTMTPTLVIFPTPGDPKFPSEYVFKRVGYGGDGAMLARDIFTAIRQFYGKYAPAQCPGPYCPNPVEPDSPYPPYRPKPDQPDVPPWPDPQPLPPMPTEPDSGFELPQMDLQMWVLLAIVVVGVWIYIDWKKEKRRGTFRKNTGGSVADDDISGGDSGQGNGS